MEDKHTRLERENSHPNITRRHLRKSFQDETSPEIPPESVPIRIVYLTLVMVLALALWIRFDDYKHWRTNQDRGLFLGQIYTTTYDGYYYLQIARELAEGTYQPIDSARAVPDGPPPLTRPPMLSYVIAKAALLLPWSVNSIGSVTAGLLGALLVIPTFLLARLYGGTISGLVAAALVAVVPYYAYRSSIGWVDTDVMNVTWTVTATWLFAQFGLIEGRRRYFYLAGGFLVMFLFLWWWDMSPAAVTVLTLIPFGVALTFYYRPPRKELTVFAVVMSLVFIGLIAWKGLDGPVNLIREGYYSIAHITKIQTSVFPSTGVSISEQKLSSLRAIIGATTGSKPFLVLSVLGILLLIWRRPKQFLFLSNLLLLTVLAIFFAERFLLFIAPFAGIGLGYSVAEIYRAKRHHPALGPVALIITLLAIAPVAKDSLNATYWPKPHPSLLSLIDATGKYTEKDAVIWSWWDYAYPTNYWARRATVADGSIHGGERLVYLAYPLAHPNLRVAANFMQFFIVRGEAGIQQLYHAKHGDTAEALALLEKVLAAGPEDAGPILADADLKPQENRQTPNQWLDFFFPEKVRPIYLMLNEEMINASYWWYWYGSWDIGKQDGSRPTIWLLEGLTSDKEQNAVRGKEFELDVASGQIRMENNLIQLSRACLYGEKHYRMERYNDKNQPAFTLFNDLKLGVLYDPRLAESIFGRLYLGGEIPEKYFSPVLNNPRIGQLWRVTGDQRKTVAAQAVE